MKEREEYFSFFLHFLLVTKVNKTSSAFGILIAISTLEKGIGIILGL